MTSQQCDTALALFRAGLLLTRAELAQQLDVPEEAAARVIAELTGAGKVRGMGLGQPHRYRAAEPAARSRRQGPTTVELAMRTVPNSVWALGTRSGA